MSINPNTPTSSNDPEVLRAEIERTRADLSRDVNALGEAVSPGNVAKRQAEKVTDKVTGAGRNLKDKIMGSNDDSSYRGSSYGYADDGGPGMGERVSNVASGVSGAASDAGERISDVTSTAVDKVTEAPAAARRQAQGNPMAAGLIALGAGWLLGSLLPGSQKERELAVKAKETAQDKGQPLVEEVKSVAQDAADNIRPQAEQAAASLKETAQDSVQNVKDQGQGAVQDVKASAQESKDNVQSHSQNS